MLVNELAEEKNIVSDSIVPITDFTEIKLKNTSWKQDILKLKYENFIQIKKEKQDKVKKLINEFNLIYIQWLKTKKRMEEPSYEIKIAILLTGSYYLQTMLPTSDVDLIFLAPLHISFKIFYEEFFYILKKKVLKIELFDFEVRESAFIPLVRFKCHYEKKKSILFDCTFVQITWSNFFLLSQKRNILEIPFVVKQKSCFYILNSLRCLIAIETLILDGENAQNSKKKKKKTFCCIKNRMENIVRFQRVISRRIIILSQ